MFHTIKKISLLTTSIVAAFIIFMGVMIANAWAPPGNNPPEGNVAAPINVGNIGQVKGGGIGLNFNGVADSIGLWVKNGKVWIGGTNIDDSLPNATYANFVLRPNPGDSFAAGFVLTADAAGGGTWQQPANTGGGVCYVKHSGDPNIAPTCPNPDPAGNTWTEVDDLGTWGFCELAYAGGFAPGGAPLGGSSAISYHPPVIGGGGPWPSGPGCPSTWAPVPGGPAGMPSALWRSYDTGKTILCCKQ